jgi:hypothetical protein
VVGGRVDEIGMWPFELIEEESSSVSTIYVGYAGRICAYGSIVAK